MPTPETGDALRRLSVPPERPQFFEELRGRMQEHDRASARRWRLTSMVVAAVAVAIAATGSVLAAQTYHSSASGKTVVVDHTISCRVAPTRVVYVSASVEIHASADHNNPARVFPAAVYVTTWPRYVNPKDTRSGTIGQFSFNGADKGIVVDPLRCHATKKNVPLASGGLPSNGTNTQSFLGGARRVCDAAGNILVRYRVTELGGVPQQARVAVRNDDTRGKPLAYVEWTTKRVTTFTPASCLPFQYVPVP